MLHRRGASTLGDCALMVVANSGVTIAARGRAAVSLAMSRSACSGLSIIDGRRRIGLQEAIADAADDHLNHRTPPSMGPDAKGEICAEQNLFCIFAGSSRGWESCRHDT